MTGLRLTLVHPRFRDPTGDIPLGLATLAAWVRRDLPEVEVALHDGTFSPGISAAAAFFDRNRPDVVGIGTGTLALPDAIAVARCAHARGARVVLGGPHPTLCADDLLRRHPEVDAVVVGEGEESLVDLLRFGFDAATPPPGVVGRDGRGHPVHGPPRAPLSDLDRLPHPAWDLLDMPRYLATWGRLDARWPGLPGAAVSASRGCPFHCSFCQPALSRLFGPGLRLRSPGHVVAEVVALRSRHGVRGIWFTDDTFTVHHDWVASFCDAWRASGLDLPWGCTSRADLLDPEILDRMVDAGLASLGLGLESAVDRVRNGIYEKGVSLERIEAAVHHAHARGVHTFLFVMLGAPGERLAEMATTLRTASRLPADDASISLCVPLPGTALRARLEDAGVHLSDDAAHYDYYRAQPFAGTLPPWALRGLQRWGWARFYAVPRRWSALLRRVAHPAGRRGLARHLARLAPRG
ncbi:MAG: radical SAM protein [Deltaproteobacteria bacterium]|nr:radical SAM protein [Deltaproteobacteria bacterium]